MSSVADTVPPAAPNRSGLASRPNRAAMRAEMEIARKYIGRVPWEMVVWGLGNLVVWLSLWPLVLLGLLPLWAGFAIATVCVTISYLPSHEAQHSIIAAQGTRLRWLNELVGHVSIIPLVLPYRMAWILHRRHHAHANHPQLDPDSHNRADTWWRSIWNGVLARQPGSESAYRTLGRESEDPEVGRALAEAALLTITHFTVLAVLAWSGYALEACFLWWLPRVIGIAYISLFLSWAPHHPMEEMGRYRDTRAWRSPVGTLASMWMEFHIIHHLYPTIPLLDTKRAWKDLRPLLVESGCRVEGL